MPSDETKNEAPSAFDAAADSSGTPDNTGETKATEATGLTRRDVLKPMAAAALFTIVPRRVLGGKAGPAPSDTLNLAGIGVGDMGGEFISNMDSENIVALADVDFDYAAETFKNYPEAKQYKDYRVMLEKEKNIDGVVIGTPDHTHALVTMAALQLGKHVYVAKPMCRTVFETRAVTKLAREKKVVTQVSTQSGASESACATAEILMSGVIGNVREIHVSTDRPIWPQGIARPTGNFPVPKSLDWDLWLGGAPFRPYNPLYHPFNWRGFYDFGTGALGDFAPHLFNSFWDALKLTYPTRVSSSPALASEVVAGAEGTRGPERQIRSKKTKYPETFPVAQIITFEFPERNGMPPLRLIWYDGNLMPPRPLGYDASYRAPATYFVGEKGVLIPGGGPFGGRGGQRGPAPAAGAAGAAAGRGPAPAGGAAGGRAPGRGRGAAGTSIAMAGNAAPAASGVTPRQPFLLLVDGKETEYQTPPKTLARSIGHYKEFLVAAKGGQPTNCGFDYDSLFHESFLLGVIAQRTGKDISYDASKMEITNDADANALLHPPYRTGWSI